MAGMAGRTVTILLAVEPPLLGEVLLRLLSRPGACAGAATVVTTPLDPDASSPPPRFDVLITTPGVTVRAQASRSIRLRAPAPARGGPASVGLDPESLTDLLRQLDDVVCSLAGSVTI